MTILENLHQEIKKMALSNSEACDDTLKYDTGEATERPAINVSCDMKLVYSGVIGMLAGMKHASWTRAKT